VPLRRWPVGGEALPGFVTLRTESANLSSRRGSKLLGEILSGVWLVGVPWPSANQGMSRRGFIDDNTESPGTDDACACFQRTKISARIHRPVTWRTDYIVPESPDLFFVQVLGAHD